MIVTFNTIRFIQYFGPKRDQALIMKIIDDVLDAPENYASPTPEDDVFPPDFIEHSLDYRQYFDQIMQNRSKTLPEELRKLVFASINHIRFQQTGNHEDIYNAWCLNPQFGPIAFDYLVSLISQPGQHDFDTLVTHLCNETPYLKLVCTMAIKNIGGLRKKLSKDCLFRIRHLHSKLNSDVVFNERRNLLRGIVPCEYIQSNKSTNDLSTSGIKAFFFSDDFMTQKIVNDPFYYDHIHLIFPWPPTSLKPHPRVSILTHNSNISEAHDLLPELFGAGENLVIFGYLSPNLETVDAPLLRELISTWNYSDTIAVYDKEAKEFVLMATKLTDLAHFKGPYKPYLGWKNRICFESILIRALRSYSNIIIFDLHLNDITSTFEWNDISYPFCIRTLIDHKIYLNTKN